MRPAIQESPRGRHTNAAGADFYGGRADTFQQITMPETFFGFLNFTPRVALAWNPGGAAGTVIRAGFGIFDDILGPTVYVGNRKTTIEDAKQALAVMAPMAAYFTADVASGS